MNNTAPHEKVSAGHLQRDAFLYVRQSTLHQVIENTESTQRQYALRQRAVALGWPVERVRVIDCDLGLSGASSADREGFQKLVTEVGLGHAGIVLGLEVSRLARNCSDWHRLLELCAVSGTLILDEDGLYDPCSFNDRLLLGLKGTMSEAELHLLRARLRGGLLNKARRGELRTPLPAGLAYDALDRVVLHPDAQVQQAVRTLFTTFDRTGSATAVVRHFRREQLLFPRRLRRSARLGRLGVPGQMVWAPLGHSTVLRVLHNPRYAGAFAFGRHQLRIGGQGRPRITKMPQDDWLALVPQAHPGYISWEQYQQNQRILQQNAQSYDLDHRRSAPGQGPALLQGLVICGVCGQRMTVRYHRRRGRLCPDYLCQSHGIEQAQHICQQISGKAIDQAISQLLVQRVQPAALEVALAVQQELQFRLEEADRLRLQQVQRARYEAELAQQRYMQVDPNNRLVADALEADWNDKLRQVSQAQEQYEQQRQADRACCDQQSRQRILDLATDFPKVWNSPGTPDRERKRIVRLLIEDVTLSRDDQINVHIRFRGGTTHSLELPLPRCAWEQIQTDPAVVTQTDALLDHGTDAQVAAELNRLGLRSGGDHPFTGRLVMFIRRAYGLRSRYDRLRAAGMWTIDQMAARQGIARSTVKNWAKRGRLQRHLCNDKNEYLYEPVKDDLPCLIHGKRNSDPNRFAKVNADRRNEVQLAT